MRLLDVKTLTFKEYQKSADVPQYAILSHRWQEQSEVTYGEIKKGSDDCKAKTGYKKIECFAQFVQKHLSYIELIWIDTCCINKKSDSEQTKAINSMCEWYQKAEVCIAYLADVEKRDLDGLQQSKWFKRGWTLQELLAPRTVLFVTQDWQVIGHKGSGRGISGSNLDSGPSLTSCLATITRVPEPVLDDFERVKDYSANERLEWTKGRETTEQEDKYYSLLGIFGVYMHLIYGEGAENAKRRLLDEFQKANTRSAIKDSDVFQKIISWLSPPDPWTNHHSARDLHEPETGSWLLNLDEYLRWKRSSSGYLWVHGKAGCGKTVLCSSVIEDVKMYCKYRPHAACAVFYFSFSDIQKQSYDNLLRSLIEQLGWINPGMTKLQQMCERNSRPQCYELKEILFLSIESYEEVFLILDAIDECPEHYKNEARSELLKFLEQLTHQTPNMKIFATSRFDDEVAAFMKCVGAHEVKIDTGLVNEDIQKFVSAQISGSVRLNRLDQTMQKLIANTLAQKADGMFRWAFCQLEELKSLKLTKPSRIKEALRTLPKSLNETYERMLEEIGELYHNEALNLLKWLAYAKSPPRVGELVEVLVIDSESDRVDAHDRGHPRDVFAILGALVTIYSDDNSDDDSDGDNKSIPGNESKKRIRLAHSSVKEFLESKHIKESKVKHFHLDEAEGHQFLSQSCVKYIMHYSSSQRMGDKGDLATFPLLAYAAENWYYHSSLQGPNDLSYGKKLLYSDTFRNIWLDVHQPEFFSNLFPYERHHGPALYYAICCGLGAIVDDLLRSGADVNAPGGYFGSALQAASAKGYEGIVKILIDNGADVNAQGGYYGNALLGASWRGYEGIVKILIDNGADVNAQGGNRHSNALIGASWRGYEGIVKILIDNRVDFNAQGGDFGTALQAALWGGYEGIVKILIDSGANVNTKGGHYGNALQTASSRGNEGIVKILIDNGADVNAQGGPFGTALAAASSRGHESIVRVLIDSGADTNAQGGRFGSALQAASFGGYEGIFKILIDSGADVNTEGGRYGNALAAASERGREDIVKILIESGADVNAKGKRGSALELALSEGHDNIAKILRASGAI